MLLLKFARFFVDCRANLRDERSSKRSTPMTSTTQILPTQNEAWGFFGTMSTVGENPAEAWNEAFRQITQATGNSPEGIRDFLDSRDGRHFADTVTGGSFKGSLEARIASAVQDWQRLKITSKMEREHGIPAGLPYLTGWCGYYQIEADQA
jgi:hypothetical protein